MVLELRTTLLILLSKTTYTRKTKQGRWSGMLHEYHRVAGLMVNIDTKIKGNLPSYDTRSRNVTVFDRRNELILQITKF